MQNTADTWAVGGESKRYQFNLLGQRKIGMQYTGVGLPIDLATISMNPAGLAVVDRNGFITGGNPSCLKSSFWSVPEFLQGLEGNYRANTNSRVRAPFSFLKTRWQSAIPTNPEILATAGFTGLEVSGMLQIVCS